MACELTIVMPCLNEAETLETCILKAKSFLDRSGISGEIVVADNGSTDGSREIATRNGARLVCVEQKGYGAAILGGIKASKGKYVIMGDADDSYDFLNLDTFVSKLRAGFELVMGNRFLGGIKPGAMPPLHRYLGNPVLTGFGRLFFKSPLGDFHCGLRGFNKEAICGLNLQTTGMEFASEMVVKATLNGLRIAEVPTILSPDGRSRPPHLRSWRDGWRHLRFLLIYSPRWLFLYPGLLLTFLGLLLAAWILPSTRFIFGAGLDIHSLMYASSMIVVGAQAVFFSFFTKVYGMNLKLLPPDPLVERLQRTLTLEMGLGLGLLLFLGGLAGTFAAISKWTRVAYGPLDPMEAMRLVIPSITALTCGIQVIFASFFISILALGDSRSEIRVDD
jgi:glycosyltransferase involved in cell wall biosynthesis